MFWSYAEHDVRAGYKSVGAQVNLFANQHVSTPQDAQWQCASFYRKMKWNYFAWHFLGTFEIIFRAAAAHDVRALYESVAAQGDPCAEELVSTPQDAQCQCASFYRIIK